MNRKLLIGLIVLVVMGLGLGGYSFSQKKLGGTVHVNPEWFYQGLSAGITSTNGISGSKWSIDSTGAETVNGVVNTGSSTISGNATVSGNTTVSGSMSAATYKTATIGSSSSSPAALGSAAAGHFVVAASATTANASTTAITANSSVYLTQELVTPIAGTTCNTALASGTAVSLIASGNGFQIKVQPAPTTNPYCFSYRITN